MDEKELEKQLSELKAALEGKTTLEVKTAIEAFEAKFKEIVKKDQESLLEEKVKEIKEQFAKDIKVVQDHADKLDAKLKNSAQLKSASQKTFADALQEALTEKTDDLAKFERKETKSLVVELKAVGDMSTANVTGGSRYGQLMNPNIIDRPNRKVHMDQILAGGSIGAGNSFTFMRENGDGEGAIAPVAEGATKPQLDLDLVESTVQIETIAGWIRVTRKAMSNIPGFISFLQRRLPEKFKRVLDAQVLYGDGTTPNLKGILTSGNFVASTSATDNVLIEKIIDDIALLEDTYERNATDILLRPVDYYGFFKNKASGSGEYDLPEGVTFVNGQLYLFGIPAWASTALTTNDYVVGDFEMGAQLLTQEAMRIEFFEQDGDNVRTNKVTVRVEGNYALPVYGPDYFVLGDSEIVAVP